ncbi:MAG: thiamine phosphate synthase [Chloroflexota bacterium]
MPFQTARIIDANLNRAAEGLRVLEDLARFIVSDAAISGELKLMRHELAESAGPLAVSLLSGRDAEHDVGAAPRGPGWQSYPGLLSLATANAARVEQSLRVIAELSRCRDSGVSLDPTKFEQTRFRLYSIQKKLVSRLMRRDKAARVKGVYAVLDSAALGGRSELEAARQVIRGGARVVQLRDKPRSQGALVAIAERLSRLCREAGVLFLVNDYPDVALASDADGVHLGQDDLPVEVARRVLPVDRLVGCSVSTFEEAVRAEKQGADYLAVGALYATPTKPEASVAGLETLRQVKARVSVPVVGIGGVNEDNVAQVVASGADAAAVISGIFGQKDVEVATRRLAEAFMRGENCQRVRT